jgi:hypothetical protein
VREDSAEDEAEAVKDLADGGCCMRTVRVNLSLVATLMLLCSCVPSDEQLQPNVHLPGFDVWMPKGLVVKRSSHPSLGSYQVRSGTSLRQMPQPLRALLEPLRGFFPERAPSTKVSWQVETFAHSEEVDVVAWMDAALKGLATSGKGKVASAGKGRWTSTYEFGKGKLVVGYARCEPWLTIMFLIGLEGDVSDERVALRMVRSVKCRLGEQKPPDVDVLLRLPEHFGRAHNTDEPTYFSTSGGGLVTNFTEGNIARDYRILERVLGGMLTVAVEAKAPLKVSVAAIEREDGAPSTLSVLSGEIPDIGSELRVATLYCSDMDATAMLIIFPDQDPRTNASEIARSLECPKPDAAEPKHPPIDAVFAPACASGDLGACQRLIEFIQSGHARGGVMSLERAQARACSLGDRDRCQE